MCGGEYVDVSRWMKSFINEVRVRNALLFVAFVLGEGESFSLIFSDLNVYGESLKPIV